jgi:hypothetical protein
MNRLTVAGAVLVATFAAAVTAVSVPHRPLAAGAVDADEDGDRLDDREEDALAERFAPIVHHGRDEPNYPVRVDWLLARTDLREFDREKPARFDREVAHRPIDQTRLLSGRFDRGGHTSASDGTRSLCKQGTFYLADVAPADRAGERDAPADWVTYVHSYANTIGGVTLQYWRAYAYNDARVLFDWGHGGDWEGLAVHLDSTLRPNRIGLLGHPGIEMRRPGEMKWEGDHPLVWSEEGGHATSAGPNVMRSRQFIRHETWTGGRVAWWDGTPKGPGGGLVNLGEKSRPRNGQLFIRYSGLWGSPGTWFFTSGYWGPAFNETSATCDDGRSAYSRSLGCPVPRGCERVFQTAWCDGMDGERLQLSRECYADYAVP